MRIAAKAHTLEMVARPLCFASYTPYEVGDRNLVDKTEVFLSIRKSSVFGVFNYAPAEKCGMAGWIDGWIEDHIVEGAFHYPTYDDQDYQDTDVTLKLTDEGVMVTMKGGIEIHDWFVPTLEVAQRRQPTNDLPDDRE